MGRNLSAIRANALLPGSYFLVSATPMENLFQALMVLIDSCIANISKELPSYFQLKPNNISYIHVCSCANIVFYLRNFFLSLGFALGAFLTVVLSHLSVLC